MPRTSAVVDRTRRHFYGACAVALGAWETAAFAGAAPTITETVRKHPRLRPIVAIWVLGLAAHLFKEEA